ncbi:MAG TPA: P1 family peptidase [Acetobacteraceae bacterium]
MLGRTIALALLIACAGPAVRALAGQEGLVADTSIHGPTLRFDWPDIEIGVGAYEEGPTGLTIIRFAHRAGVVVDSRGGAPGTVNTDALRLGYDAPRMDAIVFSGGSSYGEEAVTAVMTGLKDDGVRSGAWRNVALATGATIYDFGGRRLNEIYPDKRLAQAALRVLRPGVFPLGAQGAGRMAMQGGFFGCLAHSGQGAAFRQLGDVKIAAFVVVNASGMVTDRQGNIVSCHRAASWSTITKTAELMHNLPLSRADTWQPPQAGDEPTHTNTTISLIVTNKRLGYAGLKRLAIQVHTSMARAIQPFSTFNDGDTLFGASTDEVSSKSVSALDLDSVASEVMWDAILASVPREPTFIPPTGVTVPEARLRAYVGTYAFGPRAFLKVTEDQGSLAVLALDHDVFEFNAAKPITVVPASDTEFYVAGRYHTRIAFTVVDGKATRAVLNPGRWEQVGTRIPEP